MNVDGVIYNATIATFDSKVSDNNASDKSSAPPYGLIREGTLVWNDGKIVAIDADINHQEFTANTRIDAQGRLVTPGFIDCHTHLVYAGNRAGEFESRLQGKSYAAIANEGGGIMNTVNASRNITSDELFALAMARIERLHQSGVTSLEIKSGYGLDFDSEIKILNTIKKIKQRSPLTIRATCLAAHTIPSDFTDSKEAYIKWVGDELLPKVKRLDLADAVDIFCESIAFNFQHAQSLFSAAKKLGLPIKGHVEQLSQSNGCDVICNFSGLSADHLEYANEDQVKKMKQADVVAVLLPGAFYYLHEKQKPPIEYLRTHDVPIAIATDLNPGSSPIFSILTVANMACVLFGLTPEEALKGITVNAAKALALPTKGILKEGFDADFILWPNRNPCELVYELPAATPNNIWIAGNQQ